MSDEVHVAVAVLQRGDGAILVAERPRWRHQGGGLEFPGGKVDPGEDVADALARELVEELGIGLRRWEPLIRVRHRYPDRGVVLHAALVEDWTGEAQGAEGQALHWRDCHTLDPGEFPAANRPIVAALRYPPICIVTPEAGEEDLPALVEGLRRTIGAGAPLVQLRAPGWSESAWSGLLEAACRIAADRGAGTRLIANTADPVWLERYPALAGLHLGAEAARGLRRRPIAADRILSCAVHDRGELEQADRIGADIAVAGHVRATPSHPGREPLGWSGLEALAARTTLPVYAIGGLGPDDIGRVRRHGAIGIAGIRRLWKGG